MQATPDAQAPATVDGLHQIIVACLVTTASNDKEQAVPLTPATKAPLPTVELEPPLAGNGQAKKIPNCLATEYSSAKAAAVVRALGFIHTQGNTAAETSRGHVCE